MSTATHDFLATDDDDDLNEIQVTSSRRLTRNAGGHIILPRPEPRANPNLAPTRAHRAPSAHPPRAWQQRNDMPARSRERTVIDLTEEPDSPAERRVPQTSRQSARNPRRTNSQRTASPPRLSRSDSTFMAQSTGNVIDLTVDSPEEHRSNPSRRRAPSIQLLDPPSDELFDIEIIRSAPRGTRIDFPNFALGIGRRIAGIFSTGLVTGTFHPPQMDISRSAFTPREPSPPKVPMPPPPPTREGFTRHTKMPEEGESEPVVICPACRGELSYDPTGASAPTSSTTTRKRKRAPGDHHFWVLKRCGHVYCGDCFENRKPNKANPGGVGFRAGRTYNDLKCAVHDCDSAAAPKSEWVGIFL